MIHELRLSTFGLYAIKSRLFCCRAVLHKAGHNGNAWDEVLRRFRLATLPSAASAATMLPARPPVPVENRIDYRLNLIVLDRIARPHLANPPELQTPLLEPCENLVGGRFFPGLDAIDIWLTSS